MQPSRPKTPSARRIERVRGAALAVIAAGALGLPGWAVAQSCYEKAQTQEDLVTCSSDSMKRADGQLGALYERAVARLGDDRDARQALTEAQRDWFDYRDAECRFVTLRTVGSSVNAMLMNECRARITRTRMLDLRDALSCAESAATEQDARECTIPAAAQDDAVPGTAAQESAGHEKRMDTKRAPEPAGKPDAPPGVEAPVSPEAAPAEDEHPSDHASDHTRSDTAPAAESPDSGDKPAFGPGNTSQ